MFYVLAYPDFEPTTALKVDRFRSTHEPGRAKIVPAHVTLVFGLRHASVPDLLSLCSAVAASASKISVDFSHSEVAYDPFEDTHKLFLMCGKGKDRLTALHHRLYDGPHRSELDREFPFRPHMTIATNVDKLRIDRLSTAELGEFPIEATITSLESVELSDGKLGTIKSLPLVG